MIDTTKVCADCRHFWRAPMSRMPVLQFTQCRKQGTRDLIYWRMKYPEAHEMRGSMHACGPAGEWFEPAPPPLKTGLAGFLEAFIIAFGPSRGDKKPGLSFSGTDHPTKTNPPEEGSGTSLPTNLPK